MPPEKCKQKGTSQRRVTEKEGERLTTATTQLPREHQGKKSGARKGSQPQSAPRDKAVGQQHKPALKTKGSHLKKKEKQSQGKKAHFDAKAYKSG